MSVIRGWGASDLAVACHGSFLLLAACMGLGHMASRSRLAICHVGSVDDRLTSVKKGVNQDEVGPFQ
eukprot:260709-Amphidinium_carterae.1